MVIYEMTPEESMEFIEKEDRAKNLALTKRRIQHIMDEAIAEGIAQGFSDWTTGVEIKPPKKRRRN